MGWKKEWDEDTKTYDPIDLGYMPYGKVQTLKWKKMGMLDEKNKLREESVLIKEGKITDPEQIDSYHKRQAMIRLLREEYCLREKHAREVSNEIKVKDDINEAIEWLKFHKEKDFNIAQKLVKAKESGETYEIQEESDIP